MGSWRAGCVETRTSGSEGGLEKRAVRNHGNALQLDPTRRCRPRPPSSAGPGTGPRRRGSSCLVSTKNGTWTSQGLSVIPRDTATPATGIAVEYGSTTTWRSGQSVSYLGGTVPPGTTHVTVTTADGTVADATGAETSGNMGKAGRSRPGSTRRSSRSRGSLRRSVHPT